MPWAFLSHSCSSCCVAETWAWRRFSLLSAYVPACSPAKRSIVETLRLVVKPMAIPFKYNRRSLLIRRVSNAMTGVPLPSSSASSLRHGDVEVSTPRSRRAVADNMMLIGRSGDRGNSFITLAQLDALQFLPPSTRWRGQSARVARTREQYLCPGDTLDNLPIRGVLPVSTQIHTKWHDRRSRFALDCMKSSSQIACASIPRLGGGAD